MSQNRRLFRETALARRGDREPLDGLLRVTTPREWLVLVALGICLAAVLAWSLLGSIERSFTTGCILVQPGERQTVIAQASGNVMDILADVGDEVAAGQPIVRTYIPELNHRATLASARLSALEATSGVAPGDVAVAQAELIEIEALLASGQSITSPFDGVIAAIRVAEGQNLAAGSAVALVMAQSDDQLEAVSLVSPSQSERLGVGSEAQVLIADDAGRNTQAIDAGVDFITDHPVTPPQWLMDYGMSTPGRGHLVHLKFNAPPATSLSDGYPCNLRVITGEHQPLAFLTPGGLR